MTSWSSEWRIYCCCCFCYYQSEQAQATEYSNYQQVYQRKEQERKDRIQQLQLLRNYSGCKNCESKEVDAYDLYEKNQLVCQPCLISKEGSSSSPISFLEQQKWFKKRWGINLAEWLENFSQLPVNKNCAERCKPSAKQKRLKDRNHLNNCDCLEQEAKESYLLFANSLQKSKEKLKECQCEVSNKPRTPYYDSENYGYAYCEMCEVRIKGAGKTGVIKNRNDPKFWGLEVKERVLCGDCLESKKEKMPPLRKAEFNRYRKTGRL